MATKSRRRAGGAESNTGTASRNGNNKTVTIAVKDEVTLAFKVLSSEKTKKLMEIGDVDLFESQMAEVLNIKDFKFDLKEAARLDFYVAGMWWCKEQSYNTDQMSAIFTVLDLLFKNIEKGMSDTENMRELTKVLDGIGHDSPDVCGGLQGLFDVNQAKTILDYMFISVFQPYRLYEFCFTRPQQEHIIAVSLDIEWAKSADIPWPSPPEESIPADVYKKYLATAEEIAQSEELALAASTTEDEPTRDGVNDPVTLENKSEENSATLPEESNERLSAPPGESSINNDQEANILAKLSPEQIPKIIDSVCEEMLGGFEAQVIAKLRKKENEWIEKINKLGKQPHRK